MTILVERNEGLLSASNAARLLVHKRAELWRERQGGGGSESSYYDFIVPMFEVVQLTLNLSCIHLPAMWGMHSVPYSDDSDGVLFAITRGSIQGGGEGGVYVRWHGA